MNQQSRQPCCSTSQTSEVQLKTDTGCATSGGNGLPKKAVKETTSTKSKAELRAERRELQVSKKHCGRV